MRRKQTPTAKHNPAARRNSAIPEKPNAAIHSVSIAISLAHRLCGDVAVLRALGDERRVAVVKDQRQSLLTRSRKSGAAVPLRRCQWRIPRRCGNQAAARSGGKVADRQLPARFAVSVFRPSGISLRPSKCPGPQRTKRPQPDPREQAKREFKKFKTMLAKLSVPGPLLHGIITEIEREPEVEAVPPAATAAESESELAHHE